MAKWRHHPTDDDLPEYWEIEVNSFNLHIEVCKVMESYTATGLRLAYDPDEGVFRYVNPAVPVAVGMAHTGPVYHRPGLRWQMTVTLCDSPIQRIGPFDDLQSAQHAGEAALRDMFDHARKELITIFTENPEEI